MTRDNLLVRVLSSCETMANASVVCTDKTGTLTQNQMTVVAAAIGRDIVVVRDLAQNPQRAGLCFDVDRDDKPSYSHSERRILDISDLTAALPSTLCELMNDSIAINSTAFEDVDTATGRPAFVGNKTEAALLSMARDLDWQSYKAARESAEVLQVFPFSSDRKAMGVIVRLPDGRARLLVKGASEILMAACARQVVARDGTEIETVVIGSEDRSRLSSMVAAYASQTLRTIAICYRDLDTWPPREHDLHNEVTCFTVAL